MYFHGSRKHFPKNFVLTPQKNGYLYQDSAEFEQYIESQRPAEKLSRFQSVFLSKDPGLIDAAGGYIDAIYAVTPQSEPEASDLAWYSEAYIEFESKRYGGAYSQEKLDLFVDKYWSGEPYIIKEESNFEHRATAARVDRLVELNVESIDELEAVQKRESEASLNYG